MTAFALAFAFAALGFSLVLSTQDFSARGEQITVMSGASIQDAINVASNGDTISIIAGTYIGNVVIDKSINVLGQGGSSTILDGAGAGSVIIITADWVNISGLTVRNSGMYSSDAGIMLTSVNNCTIENVTFTGNRYGIYLAASYGNSIYHNNFINNIHQAFDDGVNIWSRNIPVGGNYWDNLDAEDGDENGVLDSGILILGGTNRDPLPWAEPNGWENYVHDEGIEVNALTIMFIGLGVVFSILFILWISTHLTGVIITRYKSDTVKPGQGGSGDAEKVAAIAAVLSTRGD
jgi:parallel beta-helix repeat protein